MIYEGDGLEVYGYSYASFQLYIDDKRNLSQDMLFYCKWWCNELEEFQIKDHIKFNNWSWMHLYIWDDKKYCLDLKVHHWTIYGS